MISYIIGIVNVTKQKHNTLKQHSQLYILPTITPQSHQYTQVYR